MTKNIELQPEQSGQNGILGEIGDGEIKWTAKYKN